jgi:hypothetical protein
MPEGKRFTPESPSPAMKSFAEYIRGQGYDDATDLVTTVAATFVHHRDWQIGHAKELDVERAAAKEQREADAEKRKADREAKAAEKKAEKERKEQEKKDKEAAKAAKEAEGSGADGDDSDSAPDGEGQRTRRRLNRKDEAQEPVAAGVSEASF